MTGSRFLFASSTQGCVKDGPKNRLREQDLHKIVDAFTRQDESDPRYARMVPTRKSPTRRTTTISICHATSTAPSPKTCKTSTVTYAVVFRSAISMRSTITGTSSPRCAPPCSSVDRPGYSQLEASCADEDRHLWPRRVHRLQRLRTTLFAKWKTANTPLLKGLRQDGHPKALIETLAEDSARHLQDRAAARRLRRVSAPHGLLGRDHAGRLLPHRRRRVEGGRAASRNPSGQKQGRQTRLAREGRLQEGQAPVQVRPRSCGDLSSPATLPPSRTPSRPSKPNSPGSSSSSTNRRRSKAARKGCSPKSSKARATSTKSPPKL